MSSAMLKDRKNCREHGAAIVMVYLAISMFIFMTVLFLDIPYMERLGRNLQKAVDAAAIAGAVQLTRRTAVNPPLSTQADSGTRLIGWRASKHAVAAFLKNNPIVGADLNFDIIGTTVGSGTIQPVLDRNNWQYPEYSWTNGSLSYSVTITRGVYERPNPGTFDFVNTQIFYPVETGDLSRGTTADSLNCIQSAPPLPTSCAANAAIYNAAALPSYNDPELGPGNPMPAYSGTGNPRVIDVANSVRVTLTVSGVPTLFAKIFGFNSFTSVQRTATSVPQ